MIDVATIAGRLGVSEDTVLGWLASGELAGVDLSRKGPAGKKRRWRVEEEDLLAFIERRRVRPVVKAKRRQTRTPVTTYF